MSIHQKHTNLTRRNTGNFAANEIAILGAKCNIISDLVHEISNRLTSYKLAYFDASHAKNIPLNNLSEFTFHHQGNLQIKTTKLVNKFEQRLQFAQFDYLFINGNHYQGTEQILILDEAKEASVLKRLAQLKNIQFVIKQHQNSTYFPFLEEKYPDIKSKPCYSIHQMDLISHHIEHLIQQKIAPVKGLILTGGKSTRMGTDKSTLDYHGKPQKKHLKELLESKNLETFYSVREISNNTNEIHDTFLNLGPFGGICAAFQKDPNSAWLVLATDLPFVSHDLVELLLKERDPSKIATTVKGKNKDFPEPLITIYEPKAYIKLLEYLTQGYSCPRKMLINTDVKIIEVDDYLIRNVNTPQEFKTAKKEIDG
ncbi:NTP transferase domain-containing protein [Tenacibaculum maritimum]|uniref:NTP transferase domain-containing protein n=1 Tax=Tenacibaculum maritimum TaxID=107401 RepID=UPI0038769D4F